MGNVTVLITGGSGFIGTNLVEHHLRGGDEVINADCAPPRNVQHRNRWREIDIRDSARISKLLLDLKPEYVYHLAARTDLDGTTVNEYSTNTIGTASLITALGRLSHVRRVLFFSSRLVCKIGYRPCCEDDYWPTTAYGTSKALMEKMIRERGAEIPGSWSILRPTSIWGPWFDIPYKTFFLTIARERYFHPGWHPIYKSYGYVGNIVEQLSRLAAATDDQAGCQTIYLADYEPLEVHSWANLIQQAMGVRPIRTLPISLLRPIARLGDLGKKTGWKNPVLTSFRLNNLVSQMVYDLQPLRAIVGETSHSVEEGVETTVEWMRAHHELPLS